MVRGERGAVSSRRPPLHRGEGCVVKSPLEHHSAGDPLISTPQLRQHPNEHGVASKQTSNMHMDAFSYTYTV